MSGHTEVAPTLPVISHAKRVREAFRQVIADGIGDAATQASLLRYRAELNRKQAAGDTLTSEEAADSALMTAIDAWEGACVTVREAAIAASTPIDSIAWPAVPAGVTSEWLSGF